MRAIWFAYVMLLISVATGMMGEFNELHLRDKGYPLLPQIVQGNVVVNLDEESYNQTMEEYGINRVPAVAEDSTALSTGGNLLKVLNLFEGVFRVGSLGLTTFIKNLFPEVSKKFLLGIGAIITMNNLYAGIAILRGVALRWL